MYSDILSGILSDIYSDTLFAIFSGTLESFLASILTFFLILSDILSGILSGIYSHILSAILSEMLSGVRQCHWDLALAVGVRQCLLRSGARRKEERRRREEEEVTLTSRDPQMAGGEWHNMYIYIYSYSVCIRTYYHYQKFETPSLGQTQLQYIDASTWQPKLAEKKKLPWCFILCFPAWMIKQWLTLCRALGFLEAPDSHSIHSGILIPGISSKPPAQPPSQIIG